jgi:hypothetical protein
VPVFRLRDAAGELNGGLVTVWRVIDGVGLVRVCVDGGFDVAVFAVRRTGGQGAGRSDVNLATLGGRSCGVDFEVVNRDSVFFDTVRSRGRRRSIGLPVLPVASFSALFAFFVVLFSLRACVRVEFAGAVELVLACTCSDVVSVLARTGPWASVLYDS